MRLRRRAHRILDASVSTDVEWSVVLTDDEQVRQLNANYRGKDATTDVLSFDLDADDGSRPMVDAAPGGRKSDAPPRLLGDVVVSVEQAARQAPDEDLEAEIVRLLVHGVCHLHGYLHDDAAQLARMRAEEQRLLRLFELDSGLIDRSQ